MVTALTRNETEQEYWYNFNDNDIIVFIIHKVRRNDNKIQLCV